MTKASPTSRRNDRRSALTLIEVLVAVGVMGLLAALLLPIILSAREASRRMQCLNNLRQLAQAVHNHVTVHQNQLPYTSTNGTDAQGKKLLPSISPHRHLLPVLDQSVLYTNIDFHDMSINAPGSPPAFSSPSHSQLLEIRVPVFLCPSDVQRPGATNYCANMGSGPGVYGPEAPAIAGFHGNTAGAFVHARSTLVSEFRDGLSSTALFSERLIGDGDPEAYTAWTDFYYFEPTDISTADEAVQACSALADPEPAHASYSGWTWLFGGWNSTWYNHILTPNSPVPDCSAGGDEMAGGGRGAYAARSFHRGGVNVALADGSCRFVSQQIDLLLWRALSTRTGGEPIGNTW